MHIYCISCNKNREYCDVRLKMLCCLYRFEYHSRYIQHDMGNLYIYRQLGL